MKDSMPIDSTSCQPSPAVEMPIRAMRTAQHFMFCVSGGR